MRALHRIPCFAATNLASPYSLLATLTGVGTDTYIHVGADGAVTTWYYYIEAVYDCPGYTYMTPSDTLDNIDPVAPGDHFCYRHHRRPGAH